MNFKPDDPPRDNRGRFDRIRTTPLSSLASRQVTLTKDDIVAGLLELVAELHSSGSSASIQIVGGAAIALTLNEDRVATRDVDGPITPADKVKAAAELVAEMRGWPDDWINDDATQFLPSGMGQRRAEWDLYYQDELVTIETATKETLLAMKLHAAAIRGRREEDDLAVLLEACGISEVESAEDLYSEFYPGDGFTAKVYDLVEEIIEQL